MAVRGGIVDLFSFGSAEPVRLDHRDRRVGRIGVEAVVHLRVDPQRGLERAHLGAGAEEQRELLGLLPVAELLRNRDHHGTDLVVLVQAHDDLDREARGRLGGERLVTTSFVVRRCTRSSCCCDPGNHRRSAFRGRRGRG